MVSQKEGQTALYMHNLIVTRFENRVVNLCIDNYRLHILLGN